MLFAFHQTSLTASLGKTFEESRHCRAKVILRPTFLRLTTFRVTTKGTGGLMPTIALVDDDRNILTSVSIAFETEGYRIMTYTDGASALGGFKTSPPDLAILDIKMPRMDGMELLRRLRQNSDMPVILLTSKEEEIDELCALKVGADDFIRKPFSQRVLLERVKAALRRATVKDSYKDGYNTKELSTKILEHGQL